ncbi:MAG TPA: hypothetical protein VF963_07365 [Gaiellaceae bacterium]
MPELVEQQSTERESERLQNLEDAERRRVEFPTEQEWRAAYDAINASIEPVMQVGWKIDRIAEFRGVRAPTFEDIGRIHAGSIDLEGRLDELSGWVRDIEKALKELDYVRVLNNVPDIPDDGLGDDA